MSLILSFLLHLVLLQQATLPGRLSCPMANNNNDFPISITALVVSLIALLSTIAQVLQQYFASAAGYLNCNEKVMGTWHETKQRKFRLNQLRYEVEFESPVIFVAPPKNNRSPIPGVFPQVLNGKPVKRLPTRTTLRKVDKRDSEEHGAKAERVHTADNERATWVTLLAEIQSMEEESQRWQGSQYKDNGPRGQEPITFEEHHTLAVAIVPKKRTWDTMPSTFKKPYATTTIGHLIEIVAMLGLHWKEFDRKADRYRAEGNGYMLTGNLVHDLGLLFTFQIDGESSFKGNRVIPKDEVKKLCFGYVWTLWARDTRTGRRREALDDELSALNMLQVGSTNDMAEQMVLIGCNTNTAKYFRAGAEKHTKHRHLFPVAFELIGMIGMNLHIPGSSYRMLPNPTPYHFDKKFFSLSKLVKEFGRDIKQVSPPTERVRELSSIADGVTEKLSDRGPTEYSIRLLNVLHDAVSNCDDYLQGVVSDKMFSKELVTVVLREHFQEVLRMINEPNTAGNTATVSPATNSRMPSEVAPSQPPGSHGTHRAQPTFDDLDAASQEGKQRKFMEIYFNVVLGRVVRAIEASGVFPPTYNMPMSNEQEATTTSVPSSVDSSQSTSSVAPQHPSKPTQHLNAQDVEMVNLAPGDRITTPRNQQPLGSNQRPQDSRTLVSDIWYTLVFRMLCWLILHDFHKKDVQISKSELLDSRLSVYIA